MFLEIPNRMTQTGNIFEINTGIINFRLSSATRPYCRTADARDASFRTIHFITGLYAFPSGLNPRDYTKKPSNDQYSHTHTRTHINISIYIMIYYGR